MKINLVALFLAAAAAPFLDGPFLESPVPIDPECVCARIWPTTGTPAYTAEGIAHTLSIEGSVTPNSSDDGTDGVCSAGQCPGPSDCIFKYKIQVDVSGQDILGAAIGNPSVGPAALGILTGSEYIITLSGRLNKDNMCEQQNDRRKNIFILVGTGVFVDGVEILEWVKGGTIKFTFKCGLCSQA